MKHLQPLCPYACRGNVIQWMNGMWYVKKHPLCRLRRGIILELVRNHIIT